MARRWEALWRTPQAVAWDAQGYDHVVARYAVKVLDSEAPEASAALLSEVRQLEDRLGLAPMSMRRLAWEIAAPEAEPDGTAALSLIDDARRRRATRDA